MDSVLEQQRSLHEECERLQLAMVDEIMSAGKTQKGKVESDHRVKYLMDRMTACKTKLVDFYKDERGDRAAELSTLGSAGGFSEFYSRLQKTRDYHRRFPGMVGTPMDVTSDLKTTENELPTFKPLVEFSGEEGYGRYLDLHECYAQYVNLKDAVRLNYLDYISKFDRLFEYPKEHKHLAAYRTYLEKLLSYLCDFYRRSKPLYDLDSDLAKAEKEFAGPWDEGTFPGWPQEDEQDKPREVAAKQVDLSKYSSAEELEALGLDGLKAGLMALGMKCGGNLQQRAERLFSVKGKKKADIDPALLAKGGRGGGGNKKRKRDKHDPEAQREVALMEAKVYRMAELLGETRQLTRENVERKQSRTAAELEDEEEEAAENLYSSAEEEEADDDIIYNPKDVPLGWDGKPIPYWLYKLHGLNLSYDCEICGNQTYRGPKAFQQHFSEWRHAHGMRCLGIPNTIHFHNVTKIKDAQALWETLKEKKAAEQFKADNEEEFEDSMGNVLNKKTYLDLKRQNLL